MSLNKILRGNMVCSVLLKELIGCSATNKISLGLNSIASATIRREGSERPGDKL